MKKIIFFVGIFFIATHAVSVFAQTPTPSKSKTASISATPQDSPTPTPKSRIDEIKEKVANTVASLNLVQKKGFIGIVQSIDKTQFIVNTSNGAQVVEFDELTKIQSVEKGKTVNKKPSDVKQGVEGEFIGIYNKDSKKLLGRVIVLTSELSHYAGTVSEIDIKGSTISIDDKVTNQKVTVTIDKNSKLTNYTASGTFAKIDLSKIEIGQRIQLIAKDDPTDNTKQIATRILVFPSKSITPAVSSQKASPSATLAPTKSPTTAPAKKITPTPTKKTTTPTPLP